MTTTWDDVIAAADAAGGSAEPAADGLNIDAPPGMCWCATMTPTIGTWYDDDPSEALKDIREGLMPDELG